MKTFRTIATLALASLAMAFTATADLVNVSGASNIAVSGFDTVAFFTDKKPVNGSPSISAKHAGAIYFFASEENKALFTKEPTKYLPQNGGFCSYGVALGALFPVDIVNTWQVRNGKLYLNLNKAILAEFNKDFDGNVTKLEKNWPGIVTKNTK